MIRGECRIAVAYYVGNSPSCTKTTTPTEASAIAHSPNENVQSMTGLYRLETRHWLLLKTKVATIQNTSLVTIQDAPGVNRFPIVP